MPISMSQSFDVCGSVSPHYISNLSHITRLKVHLHGQRGCDSYSGITCLCFHDQCDQLGPMFCCISQGAKASAVLANDIQCDQIIKKILPSFWE